MDDMRRVHRKFFCEHHERSDFRVSTQYFWIRNETVFQKSALKLFTIAIVCCVDQYEVSGK
jgi:hypothetical protein